MRHNILFISNLGGYETIIILFLLILPTVLCVRRAKKLNQSRVIWGILGFFLNYLALHFAIRHIKTVTFTKKMLSLKNETAFSFKNKHYETA